ncbi:MAG: DUF4384 domain-containing protein [Acidobacteriota bacterium]|nr:DUF4384 domain-containing protein [Acidobacteriota bacterium]
MKIISKFLVWFALVICMTACFDRNRSDEEKPVNVITGNAGTKMESVNRTADQSLTVIPPSPDTLTVALLRSRKNNIETVSDSEIFKKNDGVRLKISTVENGFVTVLYQGSNNEYLKLFPNKSYNNGKNSIVPNRILEIPDRGWLFFDEKKGVETIFVVYSKSAILKELSGEPKESIALLEKIRLENKNAAAFTTGDGDLVRIIELTHE